MEKEQFLKQNKFKRINDNGLIRWERTFKTKIGQIEIVFDTDNEFEGREIGIFLRWNILKEFKYSEEKILEWIDYLEKIVSYGVDKNFKKIT